MAPTVRFSPLQYVICSAAIVVSLVLSTCRPNTGSARQDQLDSVRDSVAAFSATVAHDVTRDGSKAWMRFFSRSPQFYMASAGKLVFPNIDSAAVFVDSLTVWIRSIQLSWSDISVDPLTPDLAGFRASFHELETLSSGRKTIQDGYCTATVEHTASGWKFRNLHWSIAGNPER